MNAFDDLALGDRDDVSNAIGTLVGQFGLADTLGLLGGFKDDGLVGLEAEIAYEGYWSSLAEDFYKDPLKEGEALAVLWQGIGYFGEKAMPAYGWGAKGFHDDKASMNMVRAIQAAVGIANPTGYYGDMTTSLLSLLNSGRQGSTVGQAMVNKLLDLNQKIINGFGNGLVRLNIRHMNPDVIPLMDQFAARRFSLVEMNAQRFGINFTISSMFRSTAHQNELWELKQEGKMPYIVARPGTSPHEAGIAFDVIGLGNNFDAFKSIANQCGFNWQGPNDPVHFGIPDNVAGYGSRAEAITINQAIYNQYF